MRFGILGPVAAWDGEAPAHIGGPREKKLLAALLLAANRTVPLERLIVVLWDDEPPRTSRAQIHNSATALRRNLGVPITWNSAGFAIAPGELDAHRFESLVTEADELIAAQRLSEASERLCGALALWRGSALAGVESRVLAAEADRLEAHRLACLERRIELDLALGHHQGLIGELTALVAEHPLRESLHAKLMLALCRSGRRADALEVYRRARALIAEELGLQPGAELTDLEGMILRDAPALRLTTPRTKTPRQLPGEADGFTGRDNELAQLDALLGKPCLLICGPAGVGKTSLAVRWARRVADHFPDGQLYADLRGHAQDPALEPVEVLGRFARALGVPPEGVAVEPAEAASIYRTLLAGKRMLILLDNAADASQVRPLLPGEPGCLVLITSRHRLSGLVATEGAHRLALDVLPMWEALALLRTLLGARIEIEHLAAEELVSLCEGLPLALRIAAATLVDWPSDPIAAHVERLRDGDRLGGLSMVDDDQASVRRAFDLSHARLAPGAQRMFGLLGVVPGQDFTTAAAAALACTVPATVRPHLDQLVSAHLIDHRGHDVFCFHDLLRLYASELVPPGERHAGLARLLDFYIDGVNAAARVLYPENLRLSDHCGPNSFADDVEAAAWLDAERGNLVAAVRHAADHGHERAAVLLADGLRGYLELRRFHADWLVVVIASTAAAQALGDTRAQAAAMFSSAEARVSMADYDLAEQEYGRALELGRQADWPEVQADALSRLGVTLWVTDRLELAVDHMLGALEIDRRTGRESGQAATLNNLGVLRWHLGQLLTSLEYCEQAVALYRRSGALIGEGMSATNVGGVLLHLGRDQEAGETLTRALELNRRLGNLAFEVLGRAELGVLHLRTGDVPAALRCTRSALARSEELGSTRIRVDVLNVAGAVLLGTGQPEEAQEHHLLAQKLLSATLYRPGNVMTLLGLANVSLATCALDAARDFATKALAISRRSGFRLSEGEALNVLAAVCLAEGHFGDAATLAEQAQKMHEGTGYREGRDRAGRTLNHARHPSLAQRKAKHISTPT